MAEPAGLAISVVGLATLFQSCLHCFELFERGQSFSRDHAKLLCVLDYHRLAFAFWGESIGLKGRRWKYRCLLDSQILPTVQSHLQSIKLLFDDTAELRRRYGLLQDTHSTSINPFQNQSGQQGPSHHSAFRKHLASVQKRTKLHTKIRWIIQDKSKFENMLNDLGTLIFQLRDTTASVADLFEHQERMAEEMLSTSSIEQLQIVEEALVGTDPSISDAATNRLRQISDRDVGPVSSVEGSSTNYYSAKEWPENTNFDDESTGLDNPTMNARAGYDADSDKIRCTRAEQQVERPFTDHDTTNTPVDQSLTTGIGTWTLSMGM